MLATLNVPDTLLLLVRHCPGFDRELAGRAAVAIEDDGGGDVAMLDAAGALGDHVAERLVGPMREMQKELADQHMTTIKMILDCQTAQNTFMAEQNMKHTTWMAEQNMKQNTWMTEQHMKTAELFTSALQTLGNAYSSSMAGRPLPPVANVVGIAAPTANREPVGPVPVAHGPGLVVGEAPRRRGRPKGSKDSKPRNRRTAQQLSHQSNPAAN